MARTPRATATATSNAIVPWEEQLAKEAEIAAAMEQNTGGGQFFSFRGGIMTLGGNAMPNNQIAAIVLDSIFENVYYPGEFNADAAAPPSCFAYARDTDAGMAPHEVVFEHESQENEVCKGCPQNDFGTALRGKGKACQNRRRLALIAAGDLDQHGRFTAYSEADALEKTGIVMMKLPVMSVNGWGTFVKSVTGALRRPPHGIYTKINLVPDAKTQFRVSFAPIAAIPDKHMATVMSRREEAKKLIVQPYNLDVDEAPAKATPVKGKPAQASRTPARRF